MSVDYSLTIATDATAVQVAARGLPHQTEWMPGTGTALSVNLYETLGIDLSILSDRHGYVDAITDEGRFEWEPDPLVTVIFDLDGQIGHEQAAANMINIVRRLLDTGTEDMALVINGDLLLLARFGGKLVKHNRERWWRHYPGAEQVIFG
ncbi:hypothetical protein Ait01nite_000470 [Actinoplanes italicus]|uniref:Uncharacterized protein n=1 Tax=Actinoplanes italicus TaxID=113567 RepID=A0A2T0KDN2_9ACTN|nr:SitI3 family protein [Actinoplanes italicus]PRX21324.1 hypothetical protein CLV67_10698 [Actinoplanes italicus]GIE27002.1 hypothetical protein Ait01nite_000470 [Actinoplanes italicus]